MSSLFGAVAIACSDPPLRGLSVLTGLDGGGQGDDAAASGLDGSAADAGPVVTSKTSKIDLLFAVDDSRSMGDKQRFFAESIPNLIAGLILPRCVDDNGQALGSSNGGVCAQGKLAFSAISDMHLGFVTSSMGSAGDICSSGGGTLNRHAELYAPTTPSATSPVTEPARFLAWYPDRAGREPTAAMPAKPYKEESSLLNAFAKFFGNPSDIVPSETSGIGQSGCGIEGQLESVYQFLIAPDPYSNFVARDSDFNGSTNTVRSGLRDNILKQRKAFLRPDSLVLVIMLTDENDASLDPEAFSGSGGSRFSSFSFGSTALLPESATMRPAPYSGIAGTKGAVFPRGTSDCANLKNASAAIVASCTSCAASPTSVGCTVPYFEPENDALSARFARMKERYGVDPLFPVSRYVRGFADRRVPRRSEEHDVSGVYQPNAGSCTNPLFAASLPDSGASELCQLTPGSRGGDLVYFAVLGGVPQDVVQSAGKLRDQLSELDWIRILGKNPEAFDYDGIDPRMFESGTPRTAAALSALRVAAKPAGIDEVRAAVNAGKAPTDADFIVRDRNTNVVGKEGGFGADLNYACTFPLSSPRDPDLSDVNGVGVCNRFFDSDLCSPAVKSESSTRKQIREKAYPTRREFQVVRALGAQGVVASICPSKVVSANPREDGDYGYNPVMSLLLKRIEPHLRKP